MKNFDKIKKRAKQLYELAERGVSGEKANAIMFLEEFMKKHGLNQQDIMDDSFIRKFRINNYNHKILVSHCLGSVNPFGKIDFDGVYYNMKLDDADNNEAEYKTNFYYELYLKEHKKLFKKFVKHKEMMFSYDKDKEELLFFTGFLHKHNEGLKPDVDALIKHQPKTSMSKKEADEMQRAIQRANEIEERREKERFSKLSKKEQQKELKQKEAFQKSEAKRLAKILDEAPQPVDNYDSDRIMAIMSLMADVKYIRANKILTT